MDSNLRTSKNKWRTATILLIIFIVLVVLGIGTYFVFQEYKEDIYKEVEKDIAVYQTETGNILLWNGTQIIEVNIRPSEE